MIIFQILSELDFGRLDPCPALLLVVLDFRIFVCLVPQFTSRKHAYIILTPLKPHFYIVKLGFTGV